MATENNGLLSMDPNNYEYSFDNTINIREIYYKIVDSEPNNQHLYEEISKNYVTIGEQILKSITKRAGIKAGKNVKFDKMTEEWLDFIISCRKGQAHQYDIVEGPMADDTIYNYLQNYLDGKSSRAAFWELVKFKYPTHQISFHTISALDTLKFVGSEVVYGEKK